MEINKDLFPEETRNLIKELLTQNQDSYSSLRGEFRKNGTQDIVNTTLSEMIELSKQMNECCNALRECSSQIVSLIEHYQRSEKVRKRKHED